MAKDIATLKENFIKTSDQLEHYTKKQKHKKMFITQERAEEIFMDMVDQGSKGIKAAFEIAGGDNYLAAILCCTFGYKLNPKKCARHLKRISQADDPNYSFIAEARLQFLREVVDKKPAAPMQSDNLHSVSFSLDDIM